MNRHHLIPAALFVMAAFAQAAEPDVAPTSGATGKPAAQRQLSPEQLTAIRTIGRNVLAAKRQAAEETTDTAQLATLRASVDSVLASDLDPAMRTPITVEGEETDTQRHARERIHGRRNAIHADARAVAAQLRSHGESQLSRAGAAPEDEPRSAGFPIGGQRGHLFERLSRDLDAALAEEGPERVARLQALRVKLHPSTESLVQAPSPRGTPTWQIVPRRLPPSKNPEIAKE